MIIDIDNESDSRYAMVKSHSAETLLPIIQYYVDTNEDNISTIVTDGCAAYNRLDITVFIHKVELHNRGFYLNFPNSTNPVERLWSSIKRFLKPYRDG